MCISFYLSYPLNFPLSTSFTLSFSLPLTFYSSINLVVTPSLSALSPPSPYIILLYHHLTPPALPHHYLPLLRTTPLRDCVIKGVHNFGVFVEMLPGYEGLVHVSELDNKKVYNITLFFAFSFLLVSPNP